MDRIIINLLLVLGVALVACNKENVAKVYGTDEEMSELFVLSDSECVHSKAQGILSCYSSTKKAWEVAAVNVAASDEQVCWVDSDHQLYCQKMAKGTRRSIGLVRNFWLIENTLCFTRMFRGVPECEPTSEFVGFIEEVLVQYQPVILVGKLDGPMGVLYLCAITDDQSLFCMSPNKPVYQVPGKYLQVTLGDSNENCAVRESRDLICWPQNKGAAPGALPVVATDVDTYVSRLGILCTVNSKRRMECQYDEYAFGQLRSLGRSLRRVPSENGVTAIAANHNRTCILGKRDSLRCFDKLTDSARESLRQRAAAHIEAHSRGFSPEELEQIRPLIEKAKREKLEKEAHQNTEN